jgi:hypothetical protein
MTYSANLSFFATKTSDTGAINSGIDGVPIGANTASTGKFTSVTNTGLTSGRIPYASTGGLLADSANLTFNGTNFGVQISRTSSTNGIALTLSDDVTGAQTSGVYKSIRSTSNGGVSVSEMRFLEVDGTNNNTGLAFATAPTAGGLTERMRIDNNGNVGIGATTLSGVRLTVFSGGAGTNGQLKLGYDATAYWQIGRLDPAGTGSGNFQFRPDGGSSVFDITAAGKIGIGNSNPTAKLDISTSDTADTIGIRRSTNATNGMLKFTTAGTDDWILGQRNTSDSDFHLYNYGTSSDVLKVLRSNGYVGIGVSNPSSPLTVSGGISSINGAINVAGYGGFYNGASKFGLDFAGNTRLYSSGANSSTKGGFEFHATDSTGALDTIAMFLNGNAQLGVGTTMGGILGTTPGIFINGVTGNQPDVQSLLVTGAKIGFAGISSLIQNQLCVYDSTAGNGAGTGGAIVFGGNAGSGQGTFYCAIESSKDNGTAGDYGASLRFYTRPSGSYYTSPNMTITSGGSVGIGTISPSAPLTVKGLISSTSTPVLYLQQGGSFPNYGYRFNIDNVTTGNLYLNRLDGNTNTDIGSLITIRPDGNLGIGATNPTMKLRVDGELTNAGEGEAYVLQALYSKTSSGLGVGPAITFGGYYENTNSGFAGFASVIGFKENATSGNYGGALAFKTRPYGGSLTERMRIASDGNFALGTTSTTSAKVRFELTSLGTLGSVVNVASFGTNGIFSLGGVAGNSDGLYFGTGSSVGDSVASGFGFLRESGGWNSAIAFYTNNVTSGPYGVSAMQEKMRLTSGGTFAVGQTGTTNGTGVSLQPNLATAAVGHSGNFATVWNIPPGTVGLFTVHMGGNGQYGGAALFFVTWGAAGINNAAITQVVAAQGDQSGYSWSYNLASNGQFQMRNNTNTVPFVPVISMITVG